MKKWLPTLASIGAGALAILSPSIQAYIVSHPALSAVLLNAYAILTHVLQSPVSGGDQTPKV
jgi:hypothetical protein